MGENRREILDMLAAGKIKADEAERLIRALDETPPATSRAGTAAAAKLKYLRVTVESNEDPSNPAKVNVRVPLQLLRAGVKLAGLIPAVAADHVNQALREQGIQVDISKLKPDDLEELIEHLNDLSVDVDDAKNKVRVFCE